MTHLSILKNKPRVVIWVAEQLDTTALQKTASFLDLGLSHRHLLLVIRRPCLDPTS